MLCPDTLIVPVFSALRAIDFDTLKGDFPALTRTFAEPRFPSKVCVDTCEISAEACSFPENPFAFTPAGLDLRDALTKSPYFDVYDPATDAFVEIVPFCFD
tara:strand:- start:205 stop:507 length:303 start_codon:yes stop_codon:yes gene_type:complete